MLTSSVLTTDPSSRFNLLNTQQQYNLELFYMAYNEPQRFRTLHDHLDTPLPFQALPAVKSNFDYLKREAGEDAHKQQELKSLFLTTLVDTVLGDEPSMPAMRGAVPLQSFKYHCQRMLVAGLAEQLSGTAGRKVINLSA